MSVNDDYNGNIAVAPVGSNSSINPDYTNTLTEDYGTDGSVNDAPESDNSLKVDQGYATEMGTSNTDGPAVLKYLLDKINSEPATVSSVNGKTGAVVLDSADLGAFVSGHASASGTANTLQVDTLEVGASASGYKPGIFSVLGYNSATANFTCSSGTMRINYSGSDIEESYSGTITRTYAGTSNDIYRSTYQISGPSANSFNIMGFSGLNINIPVSCSSTFSITGSVSTGAISCSGLKLKNAPSSATIDQLASTATTAEIVSTLNTLLTTLANDYNFIVAPSA